MIGKRAVFTYPEAFSEVSGHRAHSGQTVVVIGKGDAFAAECADGDPLWKIRAEDGWEGVAWESELAFEDEGHHSERK